MPDRADGAHTQLQTRIEDLSTQTHHIQPFPSEYQKRIVSLQIITMLWMCLEAAIALFAAISARSVALLGFGADSGIELLSAFVVFVRFNGFSQLGETKAARVTGLLLFALAAFILGSSILALTNPAFRPQPSYLGVLLLITAAILMPWLSNRKRMLAAKASSASLKADAVQSAMCGYMAWIALAGLAVNVMFRAPWADPVAALLLLPIVVREGWEALQGRSCPDCSI
jgi:divalent metal cation (Fe/Co/Zn/Cd) transporter